MAVARWCSAVRFALQPKDACLGGAMILQVQRTLGSNKAHIAYASGREAQHSCTLDRGGVLGIIVRVVLILSLVSVPNLFSPLVPT